MRLYSVRLTVDGRPSGYIGKATDAAQAAVTAMVTMMHYHPDVTTVAVSWVRSGFHLA